MIEQNLVIYLSTEEFKEINRAAITDKQLIEQWTHSRLLHCARQTCARNILPFRPLATSTPPNHVQ